MTGQPVKKTVTMGYGALALVLLGTLALGLLCGALLVLLGPPMHATNPPLPAAAPSAGVWLGITYVPITDALADLYDLPVATGALIVAVAAGSPAQRAGLREDDIVTAAGQKTIDEKTSLMDVIRASQPGDRLPLAVARGGDSMTITVVIGSPPGARPATDTGLLQRLFNDVFGRIRSR
jgi:membrane-associated protease RseP (regulator of RpoE activity)